MTSSRGSGPWLLPHGGNARFVQAVVRSEPGELVCVGSIPDESPFACSGTVPGFVLLELAAQAAAIEALGGSGGEDPRPRLGYLARAPELRWTARGVPAGALLRASVSRKASLPPLYLYRAQVTLECITVFSGEFGVFVGAEAD